MLWIFLLLLGTIATTTSEGYCEHGSDCSSKPTVHSRPNFIIIFADDLGYGDLSSYGHPTQEWNRIDRMATEGMRFTQWYSADSVCSPSRSALLTGRLPIRSGVTGVKTDPWRDRVFYAKSTSGLPKEELTIAELLQDAGYHTGFLGKWHLGINEFTSIDGNHLPHHHGFSWVGTSLPFTVHTACGKIHLPNPDPFKCFLYYNSSIIQQPIELEDMTAYLINDAKHFIRNAAKTADKPFFLYYGLTQAHADLTVMPQFKNSSKRGIYGDNIQEMASIVGEILDLIVDLKLADNTLVLFVSDNGPAVELCREGGTAGMLKGGKGQSWEGGFLVPAVAWWPGKITPGQVSSTVVNTMDIFPTLLSLAGVTIPDNLTLDGRNIVDALLHGSTISPHTVTYYYCSERLFALRYKNYKLHFYTSPVFSAEYFEETCRGGFANDTVALKCCIYADCYSDYVTAHNPPIIFNLDEDPGENWPLSIADLPERDATLMNQVTSILEEHEKSLLDARPSLKLGGTETDKKVQPCCNFPECACDYVQR